MNAQGGPLPMLAQQLNASAQSLASAPRDANTGNINPGTNAGMPYQTFTDYSQMMFAGEPSRRAATRKPVYSFDAAANNNMYTNPPLMVPVAPMAPYQPTYLDQMQANQAALAQAKRKMEGYDSSQPPSLDSASHDTSLTESPTSPPGPSSSAAQQIGYFPTFPVGYGDFRPPQQQQQQGFNFMQQKVGDPLGQDYTNGVPMPMSQSTPQSRSTPQSVPSVASVPKTSPPATTPSEDIKPDIKPKKIPRPPNAWILYRSFTLKKINSGDVSPELEERIHKAIEDLKAKRAAKAAANGEVVDPTSQSGTGSGSGSDNPKKKGKKSAKATDALLSKNGKFGLGSLPQADISTVISKLWATEAAPERQKFEAEAENRKRQHQVKFPNYKFQPVRKEEKLAQRAEKAQLREDKRRAKEARVVASRAGGRRRRGRGTTPSLDNDAAHHLGLARTTSLPGPSQIPGQAPLPVGVLPPTNPDFWSQAPPLVINEDDQTFDNNTFAWNNFKMANQGLMGNNSRLGNQQPQQAMGVPVLPDYMMRQELVDLPMEFALPNVNSNQQQQLMSQQQGLQDVFGQQQQGQQMQQPNNEFIFEPVQLPSQLAPAFSTGLQTTEEDLAAMWCLLEPSSDDKKAAALNLDYGTGTFNGSGVPATILENDLENMPMGDSEISNMILNEWQSAQQATGDYEDQGYYDPQYDGNDQVGLTGGAGGVAPTQAFGGDAVAPRPTGWFGNVFGNNNNNVNNAGTNFNGPVPFSAVPRNISSSSGYPQPTLDTSSFMMQPATDLFADFVEPDYDEAMAAAAAAVPASLPPAPTATGAALQRPRNVGASFEAVA